MMNVKLFLAGLCGLAALVSPMSVADTVAGTPDATVHHAANTVGAAVASLPLLGENHPSTSARYYIYLCSAGWCAPCNREMPQVVEAYQDMKKSGMVELLLISYDYTEPEALRFMEKYGMMFPATMSSHASALPGFSSPRGIPYAIIVDGEGNVIARDHGAMLKDWKAVITGYEKATGKPLSFPESLTLTLDSPRILAEVEEDDADTTEADEENVVAKAMAGIEWFNAQPSGKAEYYIYLKSASWCGPCRAEMPDIAKAYKAMKRDGRVELVLLSGDRSLPEAKSFLKTNKAKFPATMLNAPGVGALPGAASLPNYFPGVVVVKADGTVVKSGHGSLVKDWRELTVGKGSRGRRSKD